MKNLSGSAWYVAVGSLAACLGLLLAPSQRLHAQSSELRVMASDGIKPAVNALLPKIEHVTGQRVTPEFNASKTLEQEIENGSVFDVAILTSNNIDDLVQQGKIAPGTKVDLARAGIGIGIRTGSPKPDIGTVDSLKKTLLNVKAIAFNPSGASSAIFKQVVERMGISEKVTPKFILDSAPGRPQMLVAEGKADLVITLIPEILDSKGVTLAGPLPKEVQTYFNFSAGVAANSRSPEKARALIKEMTGPSAAATLKAVGMEPH